MNESASKLTIGLLGVEDPATVRTYSGIPFHLAHFLRAAGNEVRLLGPYPVRYRTLVRVQNKLLRQFANREVLWERHRLIARQYPAIVSRYSAQNPDLDLFLATSSFAIAGVKAKAPLVFWADTTVAGMLGKYFRYMYLSKRTIATCHAIEQDALTACDMAIFSNQWAADVAVSTYRLDAEKVRVIPYGPSLLRSPDAAEIGKFIALRAPTKVKLILIGFDWVRKGVVKAIETAGELRRRGVDATLQVVGVLPPSGFNVPSYVSFTGRIPKFVPDGRSRLEQLLAESHIFILPTIAECAAVVLSEASSFGVPVLSTNVGGNSTLVRQGVNGTLLPPDADMTSWADAAMSILSDRKGYEEFAWRAYRFFHSELSWDCSIARFQQESRGLLEGARVAVLGSRYPS